MSSIWSPARTVPIALLLVFALALPTLVGGNQYTLVLITTVLIYAVLATAWNIIGGMAGQLDLAAWGYVGLGAFTAGTLLIRWNVSPWIGMVCGGFAATAFAVVVGYPLFRFGVTEVWYALSSAALVEVLGAAFLLWEAVGGPIERYLPFHASSLYHLRFASYVPYYYILLAMLLIAFVVNVKIAQSRLGCYLSALSQDEQAAEMLGVDAQACKLKALMIYAFMAGALGAVYACIYGFIHPGLFSTEQSLEVAILGIVGGMGIIHGPALAALLLVSTKEFLRANVSGQLESLYLLLYALVLILIVLFRPEGLAPLLESAYDEILSWVRRAKGWLRGASGV